MQILLLHIIFSLFLNTVFSQTDQMYLQNLDEKCLRCLCFAATNCDLAFGCKGGYCGPYKASRVYWVDAEKPVLTEDDPQRAGAYEDCSLNIGCSQRMVKNYMVKFGRDCNGDGVTDCLDYAMLHFNGGLHCHTNLNRNEAGRNYTKRYASCSPSI